MISVSALSDQTFSSLNSSFPHFSNQSLALPEKKFDYKTDDKEVKKIKNKKRHLSQLPIDNIVLKGSARQKRKLTRWLNDIAVVPKGDKILKAIAATVHTLTIKHSIAARLSSGRTIAPMTAKITNGEGDNILIIFDADMDDRGTHRVFGEHNELIEFNAIQNLFHELAHAMHQMQGTWRYFASEKQAIEEENEFRKDLADINGEPVRLRYRSKGVMITSVSAGGLGYPIPHR